MRASNGVDWWARVIAGASLLVSGCQAFTNQEALQEQRAAAVRIESGEPGGTIHAPFLLMKISDVTNKPIQRAKVQAEFRLLAPDRVAEVFDDMRSRTEDIQPTDSEPQRVAIASPLTDQDILDVRAGKLVLVGAIKVTWTNPGAWFSTTASRCFAWVGEPTRQIACEDLMGMPPNLAQEHVQEVLALPPPTPGEGQMAAPPPLR